jgi:Tfp pilus assembly protein PilF
MPYIRLEGAIQSDPDSDQGKQAIQKGIEGLEAVIRHTPSNWPAHWMLGKVRQAQNEHEEAYQSFLTAHRIVLTKHDVLRELGLECLHTKRFAQAVHYCHVAIEYDLEDTTLWPNMAVAKLFHGKLEEAERWANKALAKIPGDLPATMVLKRLAEIKAGTKNAPDDFDKWCRGEQ